MTRFGILWGANMATSQAGITTTPTKLWYIGTSSNDTTTEADLTNQRLIVKVPGRYFTYASLSINHEDTEDTAGYTVMLYRNGLATGIQASVALGAYITDGKNVTLFGPLDLNVGDVIELYVKVDSGTRSITIQDAQFGFFSQ